MLQKTDGQPLGGAEVPDDGASLPFKTDELVHRLDMQEIRSMGLGWPNEHASIKSETECFGEKVHHATIEDISHILDANGMNRVTYGDEEGHLG